MYLHIGKECILNNNELIGIFNIETLSNYEYISSSMVEKVIDISAGNPKSLILISKNNKYIAYISNILSSTIASRINKF